MKTNLVIFALTIGGALLFAGCTAPSGNTPGVLVEMQSMKFAPEEKEVEPGTTVTWINRETIAHNVVSVDGLFESPMLSAGQTFEHTFDTPGIYQYYCRPHAGEHPERGWEGMVGTIVVLNEDGSRPDAEAPVDENGNGNQTAGNGNNTASNGNNTTGDGA